MQFPITRLRRLRASAQLRALIAETVLTAKDFIFPLFVHHGENIQYPIPSMSGLFQLSIDKLPAIIEEIQTLGISGVILFGIPAEKDPLGKDSYADDGIVQQAIKAIKAQAPELLVISDLCFCEYTDHGHCGVVRKNENNYCVDNDATIELLGKQAISHAKAGADIVAPSGMMDGMVHAIRSALDEANFQDTPILSYSIKYSSALYGPFRDATLGAPKFGNRKSYQMSPANSHEALREAQLDLAEGADLLMVKPALAYLDVIFRIKQEFPEIPLGAYQVSGEYSMIKAAAQQGWLKEKETALETLLAIKRAGADFIISYYALEAARWLQEPWEY